MHWAFNRPVKVDSKLYQSLSPSFLPYSPRTSLIWVAWRKPHGN